MNLVVVITKAECYSKRKSWAHLCRFDDFREVVQDGLDVIFQPLVVVLQQRLFALGENSLAGHRAQDEATRLELSVQTQSNYGNQSHERKERHSTQASEQFELDERVCLASKL